MATISSSSPLFTELTHLPKVGDRIAALLEKLIGGRRYADLLLHLPVQYIDRRESANILTIPDGMVATLTVTVTEHLAPRGRSSRQPYKVHVENDSGFLTLTFFHARPDYLTRILPVGKAVVVSGRVERYHGVITMPHPDYIVTPAQRHTIPMREAVYPLTAGISNRQMVVFMQTVLKNLSDMPEWIDPALKQREHWPSWKEALMLLHQPPEELSVGVLNKARERLAYDEALAQQLSLQLLRTYQYSHPASKIEPSTGLREKLRQSLPFSLTQGQGQVLDEIDGDMVSGRQMLRLLQGDVGCGKTVVALMAMLSAVEAGQQAVLMAPTAILARQHYIWLKQYAESVGYTVALLMGDDKAAARRETLGMLKSGMVDIVVGTHAVFQEKVEFKSLALAVVDEQHRFGVNERLLLAEKGQGVHMLLMTATPIPRSLTMAIYGDMDCSRLMEKPAGRKPIDTRVMAVDKVFDLVARLKGQVQEGARVYWVCPLVEESEVLDVAAAEERYLALKEVFGDKVGLVHGRMTMEQRQPVMQAFKLGELSVLVSTTVIEVGVDVPEATVMVVEHAERFGLSQLHQLRGRVGRSDRPSFCILLYGNDITKTGQQRLAVMRDTNDGFRIAEEDLRLRGGGDVLGTRQSGLPDWKILDMAEHGRLFSLANDDARLALHRDPQLEQSRGQALRFLLRLFRHKGAFAYMKAG